MHCVTNVESTKQNRVAQTFPPPGVSITAASWRGAPPAAPARSPRTPACRPGSQTQTARRNSRRPPCAYLQQHPKIHHSGMTLLVRQLQPTPTGLPIELYCFTTDTRWAFYEDIQATIFDHLFAMLPVFGLRAYQSESDFAETDVTSRIVDLKRDALVPYEGATD